MKEIKCTTKYNQELIKKFLNIHFFQKIRYLRWIVNICIVVIIVNFFRDPTFTVYSIIVFIFSLFGILELNTNFLPNFNYKRLLKSKNKILNTEIIYTFKDRNIKITSDKDEFVNYDELYQIIEVDDAYYLYINSSKSFIVSKDSLTNKDIEKLNAIFKNNVKKYKVINK